MCNAPHGCATQAQGLLPSVQCPQSVCNPPARCAKLPAATAPSHGPCEPPSTWGRRLLGVQPWQQVCKPGTRWVAPGPSLPRCPRGRHGRPLKQGHRDGAGSCFRVPLSWGGISAAETKRGHGSGGCVGERVLGIGWDQLGWAGAARVLLQEAPGPTTDTLTRPPFVSQDEMIFKKTV